MSPGPTLTIGDVKYAEIPFADKVIETKRRPVVVVGLSPIGPGEDQVALVCSISSFGSGGSALQGDVPILNWRNLGFPKASWVRARRMYGISPQSLRAFTGGADAIDETTLAHVRQEIAVMF